MDRPSGDPGPSAAGAPPSGAPGPDADAPPPDLLAAVERASRHLGLAEGAGHARPPLRFDAVGAGRRRLWVWAGLLALSLGLAGLTVLLQPGTQNAEEVAADLRWAVANVVREVEAQRMRTGALPRAEWLLPLLGEHLSYRASGDGYVITGERDGIRVRFDGSVSLEEWLAGSGSP